MMSVISRFLNQIPLSTPDEACVKMPIVPATRKTFRKFASNSNELCAIASTARPLPHVVAYWPSPPRSSRTDFCDPDLLFVSTVPGPHRCCHDRQPFAGESTHQNPSRRRLRRPIANRPITAAWPCQAAACSGVLPVGVARSGFAPAASSAVTISVTPFQAA